MRVLLVLLLILAASPGARCEETFRDPELEQFVYQAVREGLGQLRPPASTLDLVLAVDPQSGLPYSFLPGCPICQSARQALTDYRQALAAPDAAGEARTGAADEAPAPEAQALADPDPLARTSALGRLIVRWVARAAARQGWTPQELARWAQRFERAAEVGRAQLSRYQREGVEAYKMMWQCLLCQGAVQAVRGAGN